MLAASRTRIEEMLPDDALVLDVGAWASPWGRADWVLDLMPHATRGLYGDPPDPATERFNADTWVCRDICARNPWPFEDDQFDFVVCSHTLEDIRDPIFVSDELVRVAKAGYVEVPSRLVEQAVGVHGPWPGWSHHRWLVDAEISGLRFVAKPHLLQSRPECQFPYQFAQVLTEEERVVAHFWEESFGYREHIFLEHGELDAYLEDFVTENLKSRLVPSQEAKRRPRFPWRR